MFDIRFAGERIIYELAMQDQFVQYSGFVGQSLLLSMKVVLSKPRPAGAGAAACPPLCARQHD